mmetsp:Transcript_29244/g.77271  ORF Transcript_29244/g.77271 Transcript_29244/m.77271 type:complete len:267 (-) Transcript_29244:93-893(-)
MRQEWQNSRGATKPEPSTSKTWNMELTLPNSWSAQSLKLERISKDSGSISLSEMKPERSVSSARQAPGASPWKPMCSQAALNSSQLHRFVPSLSRILRHALRKVLKTCRSLALTSSMALGLGAASRKGSGVHLSRKSTSSQRRNSFLSQSSPLKSSLTGSAKPFLRRASANSGSRTLLRPVASSTWKAAFALPNRASTYFLNSARTLALLRSSSSKEISPLSSLSKACQRTRFSRSQPICEQALRNWVFWRFMAPSVLRPWRHARM